VDSNGAGKTLKYILATVAAGLLTWFIISVFTLQQDVAALKVGQADVIVQLQRIERAVAPTPLADPPPRR
jgi:hypothetical protein